MGGIFGPAFTPDSTKLGGAWGPQDFDAHRQMVEALKSRGRFEIGVIDDHSELFDRIMRAQSDLVVNFSDTGA